MQHTLTHDEYQARKHIPVLDGIRAISILLVITHHPAYPGVWPVFHGATGVSIFFVLSGFLITMLLLREEERKGRVNLQAFYVRRLFRIAPLFLLALTTYLVLILVLGMQPERRESFLDSLPYYLLFLPEHAIFFGSGPEPAPFSGSWSLGIEEKFYFLWPVLGFVLVKARPRPRLVLLSLVVVGSVISNAIGGSWGMALAPYGLLALGCIVAVLLHAPASYRVLATLGRPWVLLALGLVLVGLQFGTSAITIEGPLYLPYGFVVALVLVGLVVTRTRWTGWLHTAPMVLLGQLSYGLYLFHPFGMNFMEDLIPQTSFGHSLASTLIGFAGSVLGVWLLHLFFEQPCIRFGRKVSGWLEERNAGPRPRRARPTGERPAARKTEVAS